MEDLLPVEEIDAIIAEVNQQITSRAKNLVAAGKIKSTYEELGFERQLIAIDAEDPTIVPTVSSSTLAGPKILRMLCHPRILDIAESLCDPELIASSVYRLHTKMPGSPRDEVPYRESVPAACNPPALNFLVPNRERPGDTVTDPEVFNDLRTRHRTAYDEGFSAEEPSKHQNVNPFSLQRREHD